jgi:hypothetical protein
MIQKTYKHLRLYYITIKNIIYYFLSILILLIRINQELLRAIYLLIKKETYFYTYYIINM